MPLFLSEEEFNRHSGDPSLIADKADSYIRDLLLQLETVKAKSDATAITAEQTCSLLEQKYISLSSDFESLQTENRSLSSSIEQRLSELAETQAEKHQIHLKAIGKDGEVERLSVEVTELHKSKRQLLELLEQKDSEIGEKNSLINSYLSKIVNLTDEAALKEAKLHDSEAESARCHSACARLSQEKELLEKHNMWLNEELTGKLNSLVELRKTHAEFETDMSAKVADVERQFNDCSSSLNWHKERVRELENKLISVQEELLSCKDAAAANEERFSAEVTTVTKLAELYKESSEEWSRKAGDLEGVIKALETHLSQVEDDYKGKLEKETLLKKCLEKEAAELKEKLDKREVEIDNSKNANELALLPISSFENVPIIEERWFGGNETNDKSEDNMMLVPKIPAGVSGTALAASLMRDGWSLAKMYEKYQEAIDAFRHERLGRKHSEAILERVLHEIEEKAEMILDERAEHERMVEAYNLINQQLQHSFSEHTKFEATVREMKADLRQHERDYNIAQKEIVDLQKQVTVLLKECRDIQLRYGGTGQSFPEDSLTNGALEVDDESGVESIISERLLTFKDINGLVEQNVKLRSLVRCLSHQSGQRDAELGERFENELQKQKDEAAEKVSAVLKRSEEQAHMIEALHNSVAMYKRLYEEELKARPNHHSAEPVQEDGKKNFMLLFEGSHEATKKAHEQAIERARSLEEELTNSRNEAFSLRLERDKLAMEAKFAGEKLDRFMKESEHQREETNGVLARNVEFSQLIVDYQKKLRDTADSLLASEERSRKLSMEVSVLKHERDIWINSEKRASEEARSLSERVHRLQASLDTIQSAEEVRQDSRALERRKQEEYVKRMEREWAEAKKELQEERDRVRTLTQEKDQTLKDAMRQVEELGKELADALRGVTAAEARATTAEVRCSELEANVKSFERKSIEENGGPSDSLYSTNKVTEDLLKATEEIEKLKEEAQFNKDHMLQYKEIAQVNEIALKQMESAHENFKDEADKLKKSLEAEVVSLRVRVSDLERDVISKSVEASSTVAEKEAALCSALSEINRLREDNSLKMSQLMTVEIQTSSLKEEVDEEHQRWRAAQNNYERQVILQSETIQELTKTSQALASLQDEVSKLRRLADAQKSENDILKATLETEKTMLESSKNEVEKKYNEINEQNKILHNRLEALHITLAEKERTSAGIFSTNSCPDLQGDGLQTVINYLRRSKEIAETEISLFKQEKLRLQSQLEGALKASDNAQSLLRAERASSRAAMFTDEEFKSLKLQVSELNLLRESNMQLREENKYNFEECQKLREIAQKAATETEYLNNLLREREAELDASKKETEMLNIEKRHLESRISELLERAKDIDVDVEDYERIKEDFRQIQLKLLEKETEVEEIKKNINEKQDTIAKLEQELANTHSGYTEAEKRLTSILQSEAMLKTDIEKQKKIISNYKKKTESLTKDKEELMKEKQALSKQIEESSKEKQALSKQIESSIKEKQALSKQIEDLIKEKQTLSKQIEDFRTSKKTIGDTSTEQAMKEKDTRIHMLEKTIEREKARRVKTEDTVVGLVANVRQEKQKMVEELEKHKRARESLLLLESGTSAAQLPSETGLDDQTSAYLLAVDNFEEEAQSILTDVTVSHQSSAETPLVASTSGTIGYQASAQGHVTQPSLMALATNPSQSKPAEEREKQALTARPNLDTRKTGRKLVRPRLERSREQISDVDMLEIEGATTMEEPNAAPSHDPEIQGPLLKKLKGSDSPTAGISTEEQAAQSSEIPEKLPNMEETGDVYLASSEELVDIVKDEEMDNETDPTEELKEPLDSSNQGNLRNDSTAAAELLVEKAIETDEVFDDVSKGLELQDLQYSALEAENETEEGELVLGGTEQQEVSDIPVNVGDSEAGESQTELLDDDVDALAAEVSLGEGKNKSGEVLEEVNEASDKSNNNNGDNNNYKNTVFESKRSPQASFGGGEESSSDVSQNVVSKQATRSPVREREEEKEAPPAGRIVNLGERARENSFLRRAGVMNPILARGRGRAGVAQKRIGRGRGVRGQPPRDQEQ